MSFFVALGVAVNTECCRYVLCYLTTPTEVAGYGFTGVCLSVCLSDCLVLVNGRCTDYVLVMSMTVHGDQTGEAYSNSGRT